MQDIITPVKNTEKTLCLAKDLTWGLLVSRVKPTSSFVLTEISIIFYSAHLTRGKKRLTWSYDAPLLSSLTYISIFSDSVLPSVSHSHLCLLRSPFPPPPRALMSFHCFPLLCLPYHLNDVMWMMALVSLAVWYDVWEWESVREGERESEREVGRRLHGPQIQKVNGISGRVAQLEQQHTAQFISCRRFSWPRGVCADAVCAN